jgi:hypothetical protein
VRPESDGTVRGAGAGCRRGGCCARTAACAAVSNASTWTAPHVSRERGAEAIIFRLGDSRELWLDISNMKARNPAREARLPEPAPNMAILSASAPALRRGRAQEEPMTTTSAFARHTAAVTSILVLATACSQLGGLGSVLGGATAPQTGQVSGTVQGVDTRNQQIVLQQTNGQSVSLLFDAQTQVTYQNRNYSVTNLERGDRITARIQQANNGGYYTDLVQVDQSVQSSGGVYSGNNGSAGNGTVQTLQGTVRQVDRSNGLFALDVGNYNTLTVSLPYNPSQNDLNRFQNLRVGEAVRFYGVFLNNNRVELRRFY